MSRERSEHATGGRRYIRLLYAGSMTEAKRRPPRRAEIVLGLALIALIGGLLLFLML